MPVPLRGLSGYRVFRDGLAYADIPDPGLMAFRDHVAQADTLSYQVAALYGNVESAPSNSVTVVIEGVEVSDGTVVPLIGLAASPNPFSEDAELRLELETGADLRLEIFNLRGQRVRVLAAGRYAAGGHRFVWHGDDDKGANVGNGVYLIRVQTGKTILTKRLVLLK